MTQANLQLLLNTSWTLHRLSPLHHGKESQNLFGNPAALKIYADRLRDQLTGDVLAGLQVGLNASGATEDESLSRTGALKNCTWETISELSSLENDQQPSSSSSETISGIMVIVEYENITYKAALISNSNGSRTASKRKESTFLPLLLTRFPNPLRQTFISFLSANFDTYCSTLRLPSSFMCAGLETYINILMSTNRDARSTASQGILEDVVKEMQLTLSFSPAIAPALKSLSVNIPRGSFTSFVHANNSSQHGSVLSGLSSYIENHLAMKLDLDGSASDHILAKKYVRLTKIACGGFVLGSEGRMKLVAPPDRNPSEEDSGGDTVEAQNSQSRLMLRASEALLQAVLRRAVTSDDQET